VGTTRDLGCAELWEKSLEQSLARRGRPRRASVELYRLKPERDLSSARPLRESSAYWQIRRTAAERAAMPLSSAGGGAALALLAATTLPSLLGGRGAATAIHAHAVTPASPSGKLTAAVTRVRAATKARRPVTAAAVAVSTPSHAETAPDRTTSEFTALSHPVTSSHTTESHHAIVDGAVLDGTQAKMRATIPSSSTPATQATATVASDAVVSDAVHARRRSTPVARVATPTAGPVAAASHRVTRPVIPTAEPTNPATHPITKAANPVTKATTPITKPTTHAALPTTPATHHPAPTAPTSTAAPTAGPTGGATAGPLPAPAPRAPVTKGAPRPTTATHLTGVQALQARLGVTVDGDFGPMTKAAVESFQRAHGLIPNGVVGSATRAALGLGPGPVLREAGTTTTTSNPATAPTTAPSLLTGPTGGSSLGSSTPSTAATTEIAEMVAAGNAIATRPYVYGGGHASFNSIGYDCSGSVSYVLHAAGLLSAPEDSSQLESYGAPGPGRYVTIYADAGHAWMTIDGRRFDTVALQETGTRWSSTMASTAGYVVRHPVGL
jgi:peptidoglycan hydrolase-like protein with peptidoglycan-binding domain